MLKVGPTWALLALAIAASGCSKQSAPPTPAAASSATSVPPAKAADEPPAPPAEELATTPSFSEKEGAAAPPSESSVELSVAPSAVEPPPKPERIVLLTPGGPLLVDVLMTIDGQPYGEALGIRSSRAYVPSARTHSRIWPFLDRDGDGELSAAELDAAGDVLLKLDADDDQTLTVDELATLREQLQANSQSTIRDATRDAAYRLQAGYVIERLDYLLPDLYSPLQALHPASFRDLPRLFAQLDKRNDGQLDRDDLHQLLTVPAHLELTVAFHSPPADGASEASEAFARASQLVDMAARATISAAAELLAAADAEKPPHRSATVTLGSTAPELRELGAAEPERVALALGATRLVFQAHDAGGAPAMTTTNAASVDANRQRIRLMVHDREDPLFEELDADGDGRLGTREMAACREMLLRRDANGDGALSADELPYTMIVAFVRGEEDGARNFYVPPRPPRAVSRKDVPAWFRHADLNNDGDVSRREFVGSAERFHELDANDDGFISAEEID